MIALPAFLRGETVGRILAMPGEDVVWKDGQIRICRGQERARTLDAPGEFASLDLTLHVADEEYFCLPPAIAACRTLVAALHTES